MCGSGHVVPPEPVVDAIVADEQGNGQSGEFGASGGNMSIGHLDRSGQLNSSGQLNASGQFGSQSSNTLQGQRDASITSLVPNQGMSEIFARQMSEEEEIGLYASVSRSLLVLIRASLCIRPTHRAESRERSCFERTTVPDDYQGSVACYPVWANG